MPSPTPEADRVASGMGSMIPRTARHRCACPRPGPRAIRQHSKVTIDPTEATDRAALRATRSRMLRRSRGIHMQLTSWWWWLVTCMIVALVVVPPVARPHDGFVGWLFVAGCSYLAFLVVSNVIFARTGLVLEADRVIVHGRVRTFALDRDEIARFGARSADGGI